MPKVKGQTKKQYFFNEAIRVLDQENAKVMAKQKERVKVLEEIESIPVFFDLIRRVRVNFNVNCLAQNTIDQGSMGDIKPRLLVRLALKVMSLHYRFIGFVVF